MHRSGGDDVPCGGAFSIVRARIGTGGDVVIDVQQPTRGEIRGRVGNVQGRRVDIGVSAIFGYTATGSLTVQLLDRLRGAMTCG